MDTPLSRQIGIMGFHPFEIGIMHSKNIPLYQVDIFTADLSNHSIHGLVGNSLE